MSILPILSTTSTMSLPSLDAVRHTRYATRKEDGMAKFRLLARGVLCSEKSILLAHNKRKKHTFLPGGRVAVGESAPRALEREFREETGLKVRIDRFLGAIEHRYKRDGKMTYEVNLIFLVNCPKAKAGKEVKSRESHLEFLWQKRTRLGAARLEPRPLRRWLPKILKTEGAAIWDSTLGAIDD